MPVIEQKEIRELLFKIGVPTHTKGYEYLISAIEKSAKDSSISKCHELYPEIAQEHGSQPKAVETRMRYAIRETLANCPTEYLYDIFKGRKQLSISRFISCIIEYLKINGGRKNG